MSPFSLAGFVLLSPLGGDERDRTDDPLLAKQVLSQLSYTPVYEDAFAPSKLNNDLKVLKDLTLDTKIFFDFPFSIERR